MTDLTIAVALGNGRAPAGLERWRQAGGRALGAVPPPGLLLLSIVSIQLGAALAVGLFPALGPAGMVFLRIGLSALLFMTVARPTLDRRLRPDLGILLLFGAIIAAMNLCFYEAIARIPLGLAVAIDFIGPLGLAAATSRRPIDFLWIGLAAAGVGLLSPEIGRALDPVGVGFSLAAGACWAGYVVVAKRVANRLPGNGGLSLAMVAATLLLLPFFTVSLPTMRIGPWELLGAATVAVLSTTIPWSLEFAALRRLSAGAYGVLVTLEPVVAAIVGVLLLGERLAPAALLAVACVTAASLGIALTEGGRRGGT
jgi:inner membrane transporter RhtA